MCGTGPDHQSVSATERQTPVGIYECDANLQCDRSDLGHDSEYMFVGTWELNFLQSLKVFLLGWS